MLCARTRGWWLACVCLLGWSLGAAQITFSRDWTGGGKRGPHRLAIDCDQFSRICRHFIHELKQAINCELKPKKQHKAHDKIEHEYEEHAFEYDDI